MIVPIDQTDRDRVRDDHDESVFVEAGAGTGKTRAIVDRIVAMVAVDRLELRELAAITFTEAAASELRDRIRSALEHAASGNDKLVTDPVERARCENALEQLDEAALTTLHGFAQRILAEHPLEAGLPPGFEVLDEIRARVEFEQRWGAFVDDLFDDPGQARSLLHGLALGLGPNNLHAFARTLHESHDRLVRMPPAPPVPVADARPLVDALDHALAIRRDQCTNPDGDLLAQHIDGFVAIRDQLASLTDELDVLEALAGIDKLTCSKGQQGNWSDVKLARAACAAATQALDDALLGQRRAAFEVLVGHVVGFVLDAFDARRRAGALEFHDLLVLARNVLRDEPEVRTNLGARFRCILLDEFQDTDPLQIEIAVLLASDDPDAARKPWPEISTRPGALVVVGDPKQSIYRFRRADLGVYHEARGHLGLATAQLVENFRSVPAIVDVVNQVFDALLVEDAGVQAANAALHAHRDPIAEAGGGAPVGVFGGASDQPVGEVREREADDVAVLLRRIKEDGWVVFDEQQGLDRPAEYRDVAILIPSRTVLPALEEALERAEVPVRVESQSLVYATAEVRDLLAAVASIDDPTDEIAVVAALRSPGFGCSDTELVEFVAAGGRWDYRRDPPGALTPTHPVVAGLVALRGFWEQRWWRSVSQTVEAIVRERKLLELAVERRRPRDHWRRIRFLLDQARAWDDAGDASLRAFVEWAQEQADERARVIESVTPEPDDDAARILTVHGSKGLEFPIVVLAGLNTVPPPSNRPVVWTPAGPEFAVGVKKRKTWVSTPGYIAAEQNERAHDEAERVRLLYVATTRARDHLVISLHHKTGTACHAARLDGCLDRGLVKALDIPRSRRASASAKPRRGATPTDADPATRDAWLAARSTLLEHAARASSISATALAHTEPAEAIIEPEAREAAAPWRRGRAGTSIGRAVHAVLQTVDLATGAGLEATAKAQALAEGIPAREHEVRDLAAAVVRAPAVQAAVAPGARHWREVPVAASIDGLLVEGFIDLLVEHGDSFVVIDYKTDRAPSDDDLDAALDRYTPQGAAYALALEAVLGRPVTGCVFVFARTGGAVEREISDLPAAVESVRARVRALSRV